MASFARTAYSETERSQAATERRRVDMTDDELQFAEARLEEIIVDTPAWTLSTAIRTTGASE
jgi:hypothetical protein